MKKRLINTYAKFVAAVGANVKKGDFVEITAGLDNPEFVLAVAEACYKLGANDVRIEWYYDKFTKTRIKYTKESVLNKVQKWEIAKAELALERLPVRIFIDSDDPNAYKGINQKKLSKYYQSRSKVLKPYRDKMENKCKWTIVAIPSESWAKTVFPKLTTKQAMEALWEAILKTSRAYDGDPVENWKIHNANLAKHCDILNNMDIDHLEYSSSNGTNLTVGLIKGASKFEAGQETIISGESFNPNIPSEEVFTTPDRLRTNGIVYSSKPLSYHGELIDKFYVKFENGKAIEAHAEVNDDLLNQLINMDEGARYLGECAIVPFSSPINQSGILFYNTLFDENAVCHLALGAGFNETVPGFDKMTKEELLALGVNDSMIHVDFMIGTEDLKITAVCRDGKKVPIFDGNWLI